MTDVHDVAAHHLVGRDGAIGRIRASLVDPEHSGILVDAHSGLGKTAVASAALAGVEAHWIHPDRVLSKVPFGALSGLLDISGAEVPTESELTRRLLAAVGANPRDRPVVVVDDAHALDRQSLAVLAQMVTSGAIRLVALSRRHPTVPEPFLDLVYDRVLQRITLGPLDRNEVALLTRRILGGIVSLRVLDVIHLLSCGNPAVLEVMVGTAQRNGRLINRRGVWLFDGRYLTFDRRLDDVVNLGLSELSATERRTLELVVLAGEVPVDVMLATGHGTGTDALVLGGLLEVSSGPSPSVRVVNELYATVLAPTIPEGRSRGMRRSVASLMTAPRHELQAWLAWTGWLLDCGVPIPSKDLLEVGAAALRAGALHLARRFLTAISAEELSVEGKLELAYLYCHIREPLVATDLLFDALADIDSLPLAFDASLRGLFIRLYLGAFDPESQEENDRWRALFARVVAEGPERERLARWRGLEEVLTSTLAGGQLPQFKGEVDTIDDEDLEPPLKLLLTIARGSRECSAGRSAAGAQLLARAQELCMTMRTPVVPVWSLYADALLRSGRPDLVEAHIASTRALDTASAVATAGSADYAMALVHISRGNWDQALPCVRAAVEAMAYWDPAMELPRALGTAGLVAVVLRENSLADQYLRRYEALQVKGPALWRLQARARHLATRYLRQGGPEIVEELLDMAAAARGSALPGLEAEIWLLAYGIGADVDLERMAVVDVGTSDQVPAAVARIGRALLAGDIAALLAIAEHFEKTLPLVATQAVAQAKRIARKSDDPDDRSMVRHSGRTATDPLGRALSTREQQVRELIIAGKTNNEISEHLKIATRTVEGHIYRLYRKLGVTRRTEVADTALSFPPKGLSSIAPVGDAFALE